MSETVTWKCYAFHPVHGACGCGAEGDADVVARARSQHERCHHSQANVAGVPDWNLPPWMRSGFVPKRTSNPLKFFRRKERR